MFYKLCTVNVGLVFFYKGSCCPAQSVFYIHCIMSVFYEQINDDDDDDDALWRYRNRTIIISSRLVVVRR